MNWTDIIVACISGVVVLLQVRHAREHARDTKEQARRERIRAAKDKKDLVQEKLTLYIARGVRMGKANGDLEELEKELEDARQEYTLALLS